nr:conserved hypothetical protein [Serratia symbiotica]
MDTNLVRCSFLWQSPNIPSKQDRLSLITTFLERMGHNARPNVIASKRISVHRWARQLHALSAIQLRQAAYRCGRRCSQRRRHHLQRVAQYDLSAVDTLITDKNINSGYLAALQSEGINIIW